MATLVFLFVVSIGLSQVAFAEHEGKAHGKQLQPATRAVGRTPVDLTNGIPFNNGTYGVPNEEYQALAAHPQLPGLGVKPYPWERREDFLRAAGEQAAFGEVALYNYSKVSNKFPDGAAHAKTASESLEGPLGRLKASISDAKSADKNGWMAAEENVRRAIVDMRLTYTQMHKNVDNR